MQQARLCATDAVPCQKSANGPNRACGGLRSGTRYRTIRVAGGSRKRNKPRRQMFSQEEVEKEPGMPYTRPIRRFYLTPPAVPTFVISALLAVLALLAVYGHVPQLHGIGGFTLLLIAYVILLVGNLFRRI
jgi:hypothetical protein